MSQTRHARLTALLAKIDQLLRLIVLVIAGACIGHAMFGPLGMTAEGSTNEFWKIIGAFVGALGGAGGELLLRQLDSRTPKLSQLRFSLRTLLIATTLLAVLLGLIFMMLRRS